MLIFSFFLFRYVLLAVYGCLRKFPEVKDVPIASVFTNIGCTGSGFRHPAGWLKLKKNIRLGIDCYNNYYESSI